MNAPAKKCSKRRDGSTRRGLLAPAAPWLKLAGWAGTRTGLLSSVAGGRPRAANHRDGGDCRTPREKLERA